jgi:hypothetical protein
MTAQARSPFHYQIQLQLGNHAGGFGMLTLLRWLYITGAVAGSACCFASSSEQHCSFLA